MTFYADSTEGTFYLLPSVAYWHGGKCKRSLTVAWLVWEFGVEWVRG